MLLVLDGLWAIVIFFSAFSCGVYPCRLICHMFCTHVVSIWRCLDSWVSHYQFVQAGVSQKSTWLFISISKCAPYTVYFHMCVCVQESELCIESRCSQQHVYCHEERQGWQFLCSQHFNNQKQCGDTLQRMLKSCLLRFVFGHRKLDNWQDHKRYIQDSRSHSSSCNPYRRESCFIAGAAKQNKRDDKLLETQMRYKSLADMPIKTK